MGQVWSITRFDEQLIVKWLHPIDVIRVRSASREIQQWCQQRSQASVFAVHLPWKPNSITAVSRVIEDALRDDGTAGVEPFVWPLARLPNQSLTEHQRALARLISLDLSLTVNDIVQLESYGSVWQGQLSNDVMSKLSQACPSLIQYSAKLCWPHILDESTGKYVAVPWFPQLQKLTIRPPSGFPWLTYTQLRVLDMTEGDGLQEEDCLKLAQLPHLTHLSITRSVYPFYSIFEFLKNDPNGPFNNKPAFPCLQSLKLKGYYDNLKDRCIDLLPNLTSPLQSVDLLLPNFSQDCMVRFLRPTSRYAATLQSVALRVVPFPSSDIYTLLHEFPNITAVSLSTYSCSIPGRLQPVVSFERNQSALLRFLDGKRDRIEELCIDHPLTLWPTMITCPRLVKFHVLETELPLISVSPNDASEQDHNLYAPVVDQHSSQVFTRLLDLRFIVVLLESFFTNTIVMKRNFAISKCC